MVRLVPIVALLAALLGAPADAQSRGGAGPEVRALIVLDHGGQITLELWRHDAPNHVKNFLELAGQGFYDGQRVHRVEPGFVVQFGDPQSKTLPMDHPRMGAGGPGYTIKAEVNARPFERGVLGMARARDPDSAGSQVFIVLAPAPHLTGQYTAFGRVVSGMEIVDKTKVGDRIKTVRVVRP
jgi:cyclophilin family peptidyl-prolyl cis-trans isomerase